MKTYLEFIVEANPPKPDALETITRNQMRNNPGLKLNVSQNDRVIRVDSMHLPPHLQGKGTGSRVMKAYANHSDNIGKNIRLTASAEPGKEKKLQAFYTKLGFERAPGGDRDSLVRYSKTKKEEINLKSFSNFIAEAKRRVRVLRTAHYTSASNKENILRSGFKDSPSTGTYHPDERKDVVYTTPKSTVGSDYGSSRVNLRMVNPKVTKTDSPRDFGKNIKSWMASSSIEDINNKKGKPTSAPDQAKAAFRKGAKVVRVPDAHGGFTPRPGQPRGSYIMMDKETANKSIDRNPQPTMRAPNKPKRTKIAPKKR